MKIKFLGAAQEVTGSKHLLSLENGKKILLDCGMFQGKGMETDKMNRNLGFDPKEIDHIILSHAHIDHCSDFESILTLLYEYNDRYNKKIKTNALASGLRFAPPRQARGCATLQPSPTAKR